MRKMKPKFQIADEFLDLRTLDTQLIVKHLEEQIALRETSVEKRFRRQVRQ